MADAPGTVDSILEYLSISKDLSKELQRRLEQQSDRDRVYLLEQEISLSHTYFQDWQQ